MIRKDQTAVSAMLGISVTSLYFTISFWNITNIYIVYLLALMVSIYFIYSFNLVSELTADEWIDITKNKTKIKPLTSKINGWGILFLWIFMLFGLIDYWWFIVITSLLFFIYIIYKYIALDISTKMMVNGK